MLRQEPPYDCNALDMSDNHSQSSRGSSPRRPAESGSMEPICFIVVKSEGNHSLCA